MNKTVLLISKIVSMVLIALAVIFQIMVLIKGKDGLSESGSSVLDNYSMVAYVAIGIALVLALAFSLFSVIQNPKNALKALGALVGLVILGFISYSVATNAFSNVQLEELETTAQISKSVGAAMYFTYIVGGLAVASIIFSGIAGMFK